MKGKVLIVEDEPIVALDLQQELEQLGCEIVGLAESADEALVAAELCRPDLALMDIRIVGSMDGIQTARLLRSAFHVPVVFLTSYSDETIVGRAAREMPYGYLTKPFQSRELKATIRVALHKAKMDELERVRRLDMLTTVASMREGLVTVALDGSVHLMNAAAEQLTGWTLEQARGRKFGDVVSLADGSQRAVPALIPTADGELVEEFGWKLNVSGGTSLMVDLSVAPQADEAGERMGYVVTLRDAGERLRTQAIDECFNQARSFDLAPMGLVQLDNQGRVVRVNEALLHDTGVAAESLLGRSLTGLSMDPDPRIAKVIMHKLLQGGAALAQGVPQLTH
jgi:PAS domain S-box-containing protein